MNKVFKTIESISPSTLLAETSAPPEAQVSIPERLISEGGSAAAILLATAVLITAIAGLLKVLVPVMKR